MSREQGATIGELIAATNWLSHTTRAALTGLRKRGYEIERISSNRITCYRIVNAPPMVPRTGGNVTQSVDGATTEQPLA